MTELTTPPGHDVAAAQRERAVDAPRPLSLAGVYSRQHDLLAIAGLILAALAFTLVVIRPVHAFIRGDWPTQFFPVYAYLGERLRALDIPGWNPHQFSGAPFAGDPESGWAYLPAMIIYTLLPAEPATVTYIGFHIAMAGVVTYLFARLLGLSVLGGLIAGASYAFSWVAPGAMQLVIFFPVAIWLIVGLAAVELATRAAAWPRRLWCWVLAAVALSQVFAVWLGQASYYVLLAMGAWIVYRTLLVPFAPATPRARVEHCLLTGIGVFGIGAGVSAAAILPRLDAVSRSNLAGGVYDVESTWELAQVGYSGLGLLMQVAGGYSGALWYAGAGAVALALMSPIVAYAWKPLLFFIGAAAGSLVLASDNTTPLHTILYALLPRFEGLHEHSPERALIILGPSVALLAGATVTYLARWDRARFALFAVAAVPAALALLVTRTPWLGTDVISRDSQIIVVSACALAALAGLAPSTTLQGASLLGLLALILWDPGGRIALHGYNDESQWNHTLQSSLATHSAPFLYDNGPASFIAEQSATSPARYAGFDPALLPASATIEGRVPDIGYRGSGAMKSPLVNWLLVYNWGTWFGIDDIQGYNPLQVRRYVEYIDALNTHGQEYHERDLYPRGLASPLLDPLNMRYLIVPADAVRRGDIAPLVVGLPAVYQDERVRILERASAFPRAWLVHAAREVAPGEALTLLAGKSIDPRYEALLEGPLPMLEVPVDGAREQASYARNDPDHIEIAVSNSAPALLMLSEIWDPGWSATIDGEPAPVLLANHIFRAVPVPAGDHTVVLRYDPPLLKTGLIVTAATTLLTAIAAIALKSRQRSGSTPEATFPQ